MKRADVRKYQMGTPEYVVTHARYRKSRGRKPSATMTGLRLQNPIKALRVAELCACFPPTINIGGARKVARIFRHLPKVYAVEVFGSVARDGEGRDLDLILVCDEETSQLWMRLVEIEAETMRPFQTGRYHGYALTRSNIAELVLAPNICDEDNQFEAAIAEAMVAVDIFIFPPNWRYRLTELQGCMEHDDPQFMEKIANDARRI